MEYVGRITLFFLFAIFMSCVPSTWADPKHPDDEIILPIVMWAPKNYSYEVDLTYALASLQGAGIHIRIERVEEINWYMNVREDEREELIRLALSKYPKHSGYVHIFFVGQIWSEKWNSDEDRGLNGLSWHWRDDEYIFIADMARDSTLTHELGHALNLGHSSDIRNVMCSCNREEPSGFNRAQVSIMRDYARYHEAQFFGSKPRVWAKSLRIAPWGN